MALQSFSRDRLEMSMEPFGCWARWSQSSQSFKLQGNWSTRGSWKQHVSCTACPPRTKYLRMR